MAVRATPVLLLDRYLFHCFLYLFPYLPLAFGHGLWNIICSTSVAGTHDEWFIRTLLLMILSSRTSPHKCHITDAGPVCPGCVPVSVAESYFRLFLTSTISHCNELYCCTGFPPHWCPMFNSCVGDDLSVMTVFDFIWGSLQYLLRPHSHFQRASALRKGRSIGPGLSAQSLIRTTWLSSTGNRILCFVRFTP